MKLVLSDFDRLNTRLFKLVPSLDDLFKLHSKSSWDKLKVKLELNIQYRREVVCYRKPTFEHGISKDEVLMCIIEKSVKVSGKIKGDN